MLVERGGPGSGALHVTIAAATADLRDRFRAATDELRAELSAIGAEVDAINVEVRADLADGAGGAGGETADGEAAWGETGRGEPDAAVRLDLADPGAGQAPNDEIPVDEAGGPIGDAGSADTPDGTAGGGGGRTARGASQEIDQLRLRLDPGGAARRRAGEEAFGPAPAGRPNRIDRYA